MRNSVRDLAGVRVVFDVLADYADRSSGGLPPALGDAALVEEAVLDAVAGLVPLQRYLDDPEVEELWINEPGKVFSPRAGRSELITTILSAAEVAELAKRILVGTGHRAPGAGRRVDLSSPLVTATERQRWVTAPAHGTSVQAA